DRRAHRVRVAPLPRPGGVGPPARGLWARGAALPQVQERHRPPCLGPRDPARYGWVREGLAPLALGAAVKKAKRVGDRLVHEVPDWGTPPPPPVEDEVVPCTDHPGRENHCVSGQCGACWLCTTKLGPQVRLGAEHPWVPEDAPDPAPDPAPFVPAPGWKDGVFGPATLASWARVHEEPLLRWDREEREEWRQAKERGRPSLLERALERIGRARAGEGIHYHGVTGPIGPFAPGGPLDLMPPTPEEL